VTDRKIKSWLTFQRSGRYVNLSRADPEDLDESKNPTKVTDQSKGFNNKEDSFLCLYNVHHSTCLAISVIKVVGCYLVLPKQTDKSLLRRIDGVMHNIEMERFMGCAGMIWKFDSLSSSMYQWTMSFETKRHALSTVASSAPSTSCLIYYILLIFMNLQVLLRKHLHLPLLPNRLAILLSISDGKNLTLRMIC